MTRNIGIKVNAPKEEPQVAIQKIHLMEHFQFVVNYLKVKLHKIKSKKYSCNSKRCLQFTLINSKDMQEVKVQFMHMYHQT